ncbi:hypothetical protein BPOR_0051g00140 [Botrytis porri]|uniref:Uncharacterized protein n=1 Tax=Botrytis porri TaxID=87229 RepID=A0A4Z1L1T7_9HELO|nr:hypothetical protein BPOR_0051g00140 [Botrytis porri]
MSSISASNTSIVFSPVSGRKTVAKKYSVLMQIVFVSRKFSNDEVLRDIVGSEAGSEVWNCEFLENDASWAAGKIIPIPSVITMLAHDHVGATSPFCLFGGKLRVLTVPKVLEDM